MKIRNLTLLALLCAPAITNAQEVNGGSVFVNGYARIVKGTETWYIDTLGKTAFNTAAATNSANAGKRLVQKGQYYGIMGTDGRWLLPAEYDKIDAQWADIWKVTRGGKQSWADSAGKLLLPLQFEEAGYLNGEYFDVKQNGKWGLYDAVNSRFILPAQYEGFDYCGGCGLKGNYVLAKKNAKWGVIGFDGKVIVPFEYGHSHSNMRSDNWVASFTRNQQPVVLNLNTGKEYRNGEVLNNGLLVHRAAGGTGLVNKAGKEILPAVYEEISSPDSEFSTPTAFLGIKQKQRWGLADTTGRILIPPNYGEFFTTVFDSLFLTKKDGLDVLLDASGKSLLPVGCTDAEVFRDAEAVVFRVKGKYGVYHARTARLTKPVYEEVKEQFYGNPWLKSCVQIVKDGWTGLLGPDGREVVPPQFDDEFSTTGGENNQLVVVKKGKMRGLYNDAGKQLAPTEFYNFTNALAGDGLLVATKETADNFLKGIIDTTGTVVIPVAYDEITGLNDSLALLQKGEAYVVMNTATKETYPLTGCTAATPVSPQLLRVATDNSAYIFDLARRKAITPVYDYIGGFQSGVALFSKDRKTGLMDMAGKVLLPAEYDFAEAPKNGLILVRNEAAYGFADSTGKVILPVKYDFDDRGLGQEYQRAGHLLLTKRDAEGRMRYGIADARGRVLAEPAYDALLADENGQGFIVINNGKAGLLTADGKLVIPCLYDDIYAGSFNRFAGTFSLSWPVLCKKGDLLEYIGRNGKPLGIQPKEMVPYEAAMW